MFKSILTATISSQTTNNTLLLPLSLSYEKARVFGILSANKADAPTLIEEINNELRAQGTETPSDEDFYKKIQEITGGEKKKIRFPLNLIMIVMREGGEILILNWGGLALLRRNGKVGQLTRVMEGEEKVTALEVKAGKLKKSDILILLNHSDENLQKATKENLENAKDWTDLVMFSQAYLAGPELENTGLLVLKLQEETEAAEIEKEFERTAAVVSENEMRPEMRGATIDDLGSRAAQLEQEMYGEQFAAHRMMMNENANLDEDEDRNEDDEDESGNEKKGNPWSKISGLFKKKI